jgi:hypothetical protein
MLPAAAVVVLKMLTKSDPQDADPSKPSSFSQVLMVHNKAFLPPWLASSNCQIGGLCSLQATLSYSINVDALSIGCLSCSAHDCNMWIMMRPFPATATSQQGAVQGVSHPPSLTRFA